ncbi:hypothetical protein Avbf_09676 [Armadillidium vulgare]|nr:hypothetical protein Avbf_09676 [Armadillidium vulgare]
MNDPKSKFEEKERKAPLNDGQTYFGKFRLLMWKNIILRKRHWLLSFFEIAIPTGLMCLILFLRTIPGSKLLPQEITTNSIFQVGTETDLRKQLCETSGGKWNWNSMGKCNYRYNSNNSELGDRMLFWGPPTPFTKNMINIIQKEIFFEDENLQNVSSIEEMDDYVDASYIKASNSISAYYIGIFFNLEDLETEEPPVQLDYDLRRQKFWFTGYIYPFLEVPGPRNYTS